MGSCGVAQESEGLADVVRATVQVPVPAALGNDAVAAADHQLFIPTRPTPNAITLEESSSNFLSISHSALNGGEGRKEGRKEGEEARNAAITPAAVAAVGAVTARGGGESRGLGETKGRQSREIMGTQKAVTGHSCSAW